MRALAIVLAASVGLCLIPATHLLGYEYSWAIGLFFALVGARVLLERGRLVHVAALAVPLLVSLANALFVKNCNIGEGVLWYAVLTVPQAVFAMVLVHALTDAFGKRKGTLLYYGLLAATAALMIAGPLVGPSMRAYSIPLGFFAGSLYDEALPLPQPLYWHQAMTLLYAIALRAFRFGERRLVWACLLLAIGIDASGQRFGFRVKQSDLDRALPRLIVTEHLVLHFASGGPVERRIAEVWPEAERAALNVAAKIASGDETIARRLVAEPTHVYIYEDAALKERLLGATQTQFARPWRPEVHVFAHDAALPSLEHELVHAFARTWAAPPYYIPTRAWLLPNMGLTEGVAVALAHEDGAPLFESMAALLALKKLPDLQALLGAGFYADSGARAYTATGAFVAWLVQTRGMLAVKKAYEAGSVAAGVDEPLDRLIAEYTEFLRTTKVDDLTARAYAEQFKERPLYARVCGRELARKKGDAARMADTGRYDDAEAIYRAVSSDDPGDSSVAFSLLDLDRRRSTTSQAAADRYEQGLRDRIAAEATTDPQRVRLFEQLGDRLLQRDVRQETAAAYEDARRLATRPEDVRRLELKHALLDRPDAAAIAAALDGGVDPARATALLLESFHRTPDDPLVCYLLARRLALIGDVQRAYVYGLSAAAAIDRLPKAARFELFRLLLDWAVRLRIGSDYMRWTAEMQAGAKSPLEQKTTSESLERARFYEQHQTW
jgi:hypothetical protein